MPDDIEDVDIDDAHDDQGDENPREEAEVDHVVHPHDGTELARKEGHVSIVPWGQFHVPAKHGGQSHQKGQQPAKAQGQPYSPLSGDPPVPEQKRAGEFAGGILLKRCGGNAAGEGERDGGCWCSVMISAKF